MSVNLRKLIEIILKMLCYHVFRDSYDKARKERIERINKDYVERIKQEMYKDE